MNGDSKEPEKEENEFIKKIENQSNADFNYEVGYPSNFPAYMTENGRFPTMKMDTQYDTLNKEAERLHLLARQKEKERMMYQNGRNGGYSSSYPNQYQEQYFEQRAHQKEREKMNEKNTTQEPTLTPERFIQQISSDWSAVPDKRKDKILKSYMAKFLPYQVVEAYKGSTIDKPFWDW